MDLKIDGFTVLTLKNLTLSNLYKREKQNDEKKVYVEPSHELFILFN